MNSPAPFSGHLDTSTSLTAVVDGFQLTATVEDDDRGAAPWDDDGHGPVSDWRPIDSKAPGELVLNRDGDSARFYDFAAAVKIARRDGWGAPLYRMDTEYGANGLVRVTGQWFASGELVTHRTDWSDDINAAISAAHDAHRASFSGKRAYAAAAALADFQRLAGWCSDEWNYVGVVVTASRAGIELGSASLWGIESDAGDYLVEAANDLVSDAVADAQATLSRLLKASA